MTILFHPIRARRRSQEEERAATTSAAPSPKPSLPPPPPVTAPPRRSETAEAAYCLNFLPTLTFEPLPELFRPPASEKGRSPLAYYGPRALVLEALTDAAKVVEISQLRDVGLVTELGLEDTSLELAVALEEPGASSHLTIGCLVRVQILLKNDVALPMDALTLARNWTPCGSDWRWTSSVPGVGSIYVSFVVA